MAGRKRTCKRALADGQKCNKPFDHTESGNDPATRKHGYTAPKSSTPLDFASITVTKVTDKSTMQKFRRTRGERTKDQKLVDQLVSAAYAAWSESGKPTDWEDAHGMHVKVPTAQFETLRSKVGNSGQHLGYAVRFGSTAVDGKFTETVVIAKDKTQSENGDSPTED